MKKFYAIRLTKPGAKVSRYALYHVDDNGNLQVVWPEGARTESERKLWPNMVYWKSSDKYPAYHFMVGNIGYNKLTCLETEIQKFLGVPVSVESISGWSPSTNGY